MANGWGGRRPNSGPKKGPDGRALKAAPGKAVSTSSGNTKPAADAKAEPRQGPMFSTESVHAILRALEERQVKTRQRPRTREWNPFVIRPELFGPVYAHVKKHRPKLAMDKVMGLDDANQVAIQAWQAGGLLGNLVSEGLLFLGYPFLSELAQRPEFRLFGEIRAQEMTRKWIDFRPVSDQSTKEKDAENEGKKNNNPDDERRAREKRQAGDEAPRSDDRNKEIEDKIKELADAMDDLRVRDWFKASAEQDSYFGISHLYLDLKGTDLENQRDPELAKSIGNGRDTISKNKLTKGCLRGMRTIEPIWVYPTTYNAQNPLIESWYDPQVWYVMGTEIHKTRLLSFIGRPVPDILKPAYAFGGLSMTQMAQPYVDIWLRTRESVGEIIHAFSVMVLMTNLSSTTMPGGAGGGGGDVLARLGLFNMLRDNQGVFALDKNTEDFKNVSAPLSGLDELQAQAQEHMFSVGRIPAVKFAGIQPKGLNATSEGEMRAFYDTIIGEQNHLFRPNLSTVCDIIQIHLWGACDHDITYDFVPLWEQTEKEKAEIRKLDADTSQVLIDSGQISQEEARRRLATDPESGYHEIDPDDVPELLEEEEGGLVPPGAGRSLEGIVGGEEGEGGEPEQRPPKGSKSVVPFAEGRGNDAADETDDDDVGPLVVGDAWEESKHPRVKSGSEAGRFTSGGQGGSGSGTEGIETTENVVISPTERKAINESLDKLADQAEQLDNAGEHPDENKEYGALNMILAAASLERRIKLSQKKNYQFTYAIGPEGVAGAGAVRRGGDLPKDTAEISFLGSLKSGVGAKVLTSLESKARNVWGIKKLRLTSFPGAFSFYKRQGYEIDPDFDEDDGVFIKDLTKPARSSEEQTRAREESRFEREEAQSERAEEIERELRGETERTPTFKSKKDHAEHLLKKGVTTKEMLDALGWPSISMPAMAKSLNMRLEKVKEGKVTRYKGISLGPRAQPEKTHSLLPFLARRGGLRVDDANISDVKTAIGKGNKFIPGFGQLIRTPKKLSTAAREGGVYAPMDLDGAREAAEEAGYIPEGTTLAEFIEAIDSELSGQHVYPAGYLPEGRSADPEQLEHEKNGFMAEFHDKVGELSDSERARAVELWMHEGLNDPLDVLERIALEVDDGEVSAGAPKRSQAVPGWDDDSDAIPF